MKPQIIKIKHVSIRKDFESRILKNADNMVKYRSKHAIKYNIDENVTIGIPKINRSNTDLPRLPAKIVEKLESDGFTHLYRLLSDQGLIDTCFSGDVLPFNGSIFIYSINWKHCQNYHCILFPKKQIQTIPLEATLTVIVI